MNLICYGIAKQLNWAQLKNPTCNAQSLASAEADEEMTDVSHKLLTSIEPSACFLNCSIKAIYLGKANKQINNNKKQPPNLL